MTEKDVLKEISSLISAFERIDSLLKRESFEYTNFNVEKYDECRQINDQLEKFDIDFLLMNAVNNKLKVEIFNNLFNSIEIFEATIIEKNVLSKYGFFTKCFDNLPAIQKIRRKVSICEQDVVDVESQDSNMSEWEKLRNLEYFKNQLALSLDEMNKIFQEYLWIDNNFYLNILFLGNRIIEKVESYYKIILFKLKFELFPKELVRKLHIAMVDNDFFKKNKEIPIDELHLILNMHEPSEHYVGYMKVTFFGRILYSLREFIQARSDCYEEWIKFIVSTLEFTDGSLISRIQCKDDLCLDFKKIIENFLATEKTQ